MAQAEIQSAFTAGEFSPALYGRTDFDKYERGAALLRNFFVDFRGGATNRPGTKFCADSTSLVTDAAMPPRLLPFIVSTDAGYVLLLTNHLITVYFRGVEVTTVVTPYAAADLFQIKFAQSADVMTLTHPSYPPANLSRTGVSTFVYAPIVVGPVIQPPTVVAMRAPHSGPYNYSYVYTAVDIDGKEESLPSNIGVKHSEVLNETTNRVVGLSGNPSPQPTSKYNFYKWGPIDALTMVPATQWGFVGSSATPFFTDNNIAADFAKQPPQWGDPFSGGQFESIAVTAGGSGYDGVTGDWGAGALPYVPLAISGDGTGAAGYAVIDHANGDIIGAFLTNPGKGYTHATITANGQGGTGATFSATFTDIAPLYPACVSYIGQRRTFGGSDAKPETLVLSQVGLYDNFNATPAALPTDAIVISIASLQVNSIKALVPSSYGLLIFTTGGSFLLNGGAPYARIDANTVNVQAQAGTGANDLPPLIVNYDILYGQNKGNRIHNLAFAWQRQSYTGSDVSALAAHLFDDHSTLDWCYAEEPFKLVWAVRDDGKLLSMTYVPDQEVFAWARHDTQGLFRSVCAVPEDNVNAVYTVVERYVPPSSDRVIELTRTGRPTVQFLCGYNSVTPTVLLVHFIVGLLEPGDIIYSPNVFPTGATVVSQGSGPTGGAGVYTITVIGSAFSGSEATSEMLGTVAGNVLTVTAAGPNDTLEVGAFLFGDGFSDNTYITAFGTGTGGVGTYTLNQSMTIASPVVIYSQFGYTIPADWNVAENTISVVGCGGQGGPGDIGLSRGGGGGGSGAAAQSVNVAYTPGTHVPYQVGTAALQDSSAWGGGTWFDGSEVDSEGLYPLKVSARGGGNGDDTGVGIGGSGGSGGQGDSVKLGSAGGAGENFGIGSLPAAAGGGAGAPDSTTLGGAGQPGAGGIGGLGGTGPNGDGGKGGNASTSLNGVNGTGNGAGGGGAGRSAGALGDIGLGTDGKITITYTSSVPPICEGWHWFLERFDDRLTNCLEQAWFLDAAVRMPLNDGDGEFEIAAPTGDTVLTYCPDHRGHEFSIDDVIVIGCTRIRVTDVTDPDTYAVTIIGDLLDYVLPGDPDNRLKLFQPTDWSWVTPTDLVTGLDHLEGKEVYTLADGKVDGPRIVTFGAVELAAPAAIKTTGLLFQQQIKTLYLTVDGLQPGTVQGKRKQVPAVTLRVDNTLGLKAGLTFDRLAVVPGLIPPTTDVALVPHKLVTGDNYTVVFSDWTETGEVCIQQDYPLPAQVLGVITNVVAGDTGK